jgi:hypothetical protein
MEASTVDSHELSFELDKLQDLNIVAIVPIFIKDGMVTRYRIYYRNVLDLNRQSKS